MFHPKSIAGSNSVKRMKMSEDKKVDEMFKTGVVLSNKKIGITKYTLSAEVEDLTSVARLYVYGCHRIFKRTFDDPYCLFGVKPSF